MFDMNKILGTKKSKKNNTNFFNTDKILGTTKKSNNTFGTINFDTTSMFNNKPVKGASIKKQNQWKNMSLTKRNMFRKTLPDSDGDRIPNRFDCSPFNSMRQHKNVLDMNDDEIAAWVSKEMGNKPVKKKVARKQPKPIEPFYESIRKEKKPLPENLPPWDPNFVPPMYPETTPEEKLAMKQYAQTEDWKNTGRSTSNKVKLPVVYPNGKNKPANKKWVTTKEWNNKEGRMELVHRHGKAIEKPEAKNILLNNNLSHDEKVRKIKKEGGTDALIEESMRELSSYPKFGNRGRE